MALNLEPPRARTGGLLLVGLLCLVAWRVETPWRRLQATYFDRLLETSQRELAVLRSESAEDLRFLEGEVSVARDRLRTGEVAESERRLLALERKLRRTTPRREKEGLREMIDAERQRRDDLRAEVEGAELALRSARAPIDRLEARVDSLAGVRGWLRRVPVLRFLGAGVGLRESVPMRTGRPERCVSCHLSMSSPIASEPELAAAAASVGQSLDEGWSRLFAPHPLPDLHLTADSRHPAAEFGCTSCHGGDGLATDFAAAGHRPPDEATASRWRRQWGWRPSTASQAPRPILAGPRVESACVRCHDAPWLPSAPVQEAGRLLARFMACAACHETGRPDLQPAAPSLQDLARHKHRGWVATFLAQSSLWKPSFMPHFWDGVGPAERDAEIAAVVAWLWQAAGDVGAAGDDSAEMPAELVEAQVAGQQLWHELGCAACHVMEAEVRRWQLLGSQRLRGPSLAALADEARPGAIGDLLRGHDPEYDWRPGEVPALTAYLSTLRRTEPVGASNADASVPAEVRDELLRRRLLEVTTHEDAAAWLGRLDDEARSLLLGRLAIRRYRCGSCHLLPKAPPVGPAVLPDLPAASSLSQVGERFRGASALWPSGDVASWPHADEQGRNLPSWRLATEEAEALAVQLAGWRRATGLVTEATVADAESGRAVVARYGCRACHALTDHDEPMDAFGLRGAPPSLARAGEKLRIDWIFRHLDDPSATALRPWAGLRMPRFALTPSERSAVAEYFARRTDMSVLSPDVGAALAAERALGEAVFQVLLCDSCHGEDAVTRAPDYGVAGRRLRASWLRDWLLHPHAGASMPAPFPPRGGRPDASYLLDALDAPMFEVHRNRLERFFPDRDELERVFDDPATVADALALHLLTLDRQ